MTELVKYNDPILYEKTTSVWVPDKSRTDNLYNTLMNASKHHNGVGISACQLGINAHVFVISTDAIKDIFFNASYEPLEFDGKISHKETENEGCLSFPNLVLPISRYFAI